MYGGGEGGAYVDFLVKTLKPFIDSHYRTKRDAANTGIAGSSMGGLISLYAVLKYPNVFGRAGVFSPSLWIAPEVFDYARNAKFTGTKPRIYFVMGGQEVQDTAEAASYVRGQKEMVDVLLARGFTRGANVVDYVRADGKHAEWFWRREFPTAYQWLFRR
jgi:predicted alpha/beta superfamily hydrolase